MRLPFSESRRLPNTPLITHPNFDIQPFMKVRLKDIAHESGYSISTVSRVLSGSDRISEPVVQQVIDCARRLGYPMQNTPHLDGNGNGSHIAFVTDFHEGEFYASLYAGYCRASDELGIQLSLVSVQDRSDRIAEAIMDLQSQRAQGVALFVPSLENEQYREISDRLRKSKRSLPIVSNALVQTPVLPTVTFDGYSGGHLVGYHFAQKGYRTAGILKGPSGKAEASFRTSGFRDACEQKGLRITWESTGDFMFDSAYASFQEFLQAPERPEAVFVSNDLMGIGFFEAAREHGFSIPSDLAIASYDDLPMCRQVRPGITSVGTDFHALGAHTLRTLREMVAGRQGENKILSFIPVRLVVRGSS